MDSNVVFNASVCLIGFIILLVHVANLLMRKNRRRDENALLVFFAFTALHFAIYFTFTILKYYLGEVSNAFIMSFYTGFYIANNFEVFFLLLYMMMYVEVPIKLGKPLQIANVSLLALFLILDFLNLLVPMFFYAENGVYHRANTMILSQGYQFLMLAAVFLLTLTNKKLNVREKLAFAIYCLLPLVAIIL